MEFLQSILHVLNSPMNAEQLQLTAALLIGIGLSASCGFRVFAPPLILSAAALFFGIHLPDGMRWLATYPALIALFTASLVEVGAYYVPWLDHALDSISWPLSLLAGTLITGTFLNGHMDPGMQWGLALIAGGGAAAATQSMSNAGRVASLVTTAGVANPIVSTVENFLAFVVPALVIAFPIITILVVLAVSALIILFFVKINQKRRQAALK
ncbi:MAG: DUF4126 domain-containing protein [Vampirovibrionales bacterium]|nr:DUF4126 domain-containing protein [Vampirovibrionales bacterium]